MEIEIQSPGGKVASPLDQPLTMLRGIGAQRAESLAEFGIFRINDLLHYYPIRYIDYSLRVPISELHEHIKQLVTIEATIGRVTKMGWGAHAGARAVLTDDLGSVDAVWFNQPYLASTLKKKRRACFSGRVRVYEDTLQLESPTFEYVEEEGTEGLHTGRIVPLYFLPEGIGQKSMRGWVREALARFGDAIEERLPVELVSKHKLVPLRKAVELIHFPPVLKAGETARRRFAFEELLSLQLQIVFLSGRYGTAEFIRAGYPLVQMKGGAASTKFRASLPFELTGDQQRVISEILADLERGLPPMVRLLHGEVGAGKTVVALAAALAAIDSGFQAAFMAPTSILAQQHHVTLSRMLEPIGIAPLLMLGGARTTGRDDTITLDEAPLIVGTHALLSKNVRFERLGLVVIDEQHRFGVAQRARLIEKAVIPHSLHMSATPIPRTLAITLYSALEISELRELPKGRMIPVTKPVPPDDLPAAFELIRHELDAGRQAYIVYPTIGESEALGVEGVEKRFRKLARSEFKGYRCGITHSKLGREELFAAIERFARGEIQVLFTTTIIEIGMDVPNATVMLVEDADRFGLAQLHQLRGRISRGIHRGYFLLTADKEISDLAKRRFNVIKQMTNGFEVAEADLELRGPGELTGLIQSGMPAELHIASVATDKDLFIEAADTAKELVERWDAIRSDPRYAWIVEQASLRDIAKFSI